MTTDKRVLKTRKAITTAFMELTLEKDMQKITVSDIAERAVINRSTFYLHYADAKEVLDDIENNISEIVHNCFSKFDTSDIYNSTYNMFIAMTGILDETPAFKNFMLHSFSSGYITINLKKTLTDMALHTVLKKASTYDAEKMRIAISYMVSGIVDTYILWAKDDKPKCSLEEFCRYITVLTEAVIGAIH